MTGTAPSYVETGLRLSGNPSQPGVFLRTRTEITGMPHAHALVRALPGDGVSINSVSRARSDRRRAFSGPIT